MAPISTSSGFLDIVKTKLKAIKPLRVATTTVGLAGVGVALYDSHAYGKLKAYEEKNTKDANAGYKYFKNTQYLDNESRATAKLKKWLFYWELTNTLRGASNASAGYSSGFASSMLNHTVPLIASIAAIGLKGKKALFGVGGLALWGIYSFTRHVCSHIDNKI